MINFIVVGKNVNIIIAVLQSIRSFTDAKCMVVGDDAIRGLRWSGVCERLAFMRFDGRDDESFTSLVACLGERTPHMVLIPCDSDGIRMVNRVRDRLAINIVPVPDLPTLDMFEDGSRFQQFCVRNSLAVPATRALVSNDEPDFGALAAQLGLPFVLKPAHSSAELSTLLIHDKAQLAQAMADAAAHKAGPLLAQRYIDGADIAFCLLADRGQLSAFAIEQASDSHISFIPNEELESMAARLCHAAAYHGMMRLTARIERQSGKIYLIRSNPFFWTTLPASVWCGLNFVAESIRKTPRINGIPRLTAGPSYPRHPIACPSLWSQLIHDDGERGRLLRAIVLNMHALGHFPYALAYSARRQATALFHAVRNMAFARAFLAKGNSRNISGSAAG